MAALALLSITTVPSPITLASIWPLLLPFLSVRASAILF